MSDSSTTSSTSTTGQTTTSASPSPTTSASPSPTSASSRPTTISSSTITIFTSAAPVVQNCKTDGDVAGAFFGGVALVVVIWVMVFLYQRFIRKRRQKHQMTTQNGNIYPSLPSLVEPLPIPTTDNPPVSSDEGAPEKYYGLELSARDVGSDKHKYTPIEPPDSSADNLTRRAENFVELGNRPASSYTDIYSEINELKKTTSNLSEVSHTKETLHSSPRGAQKTLHSEVAPKTSPAKNSDTTHFVSGEHDQYLKTAGRATKSAADTKDIEKGSNHKQQANDQPRAATLPSTSENYTNMHFPLHNDADSCATTGRTQRHDVNTSDQKQIHTMNNSQMADSPELDSMYYNSVTPDSSSSRHKSDSPKYEVLDSVYNSKEEQKKPHQSHGKAEHHSGQGYTEMKVPVGSASLGDGVRFTLENPHSRAEEVVNVQECSEDGGEYVEVDDSSERRDIYVNCSDSDSESERDSDKDNDYETPPVRL